MKEKENSIIEKYISDIDDTSKYYKNSNLLHKVVASNFLLLFIITITIMLLNMSILVSILIYLFYLTYVLIISNPFIRVYLLLNKILSMINIEY